MQNEYVINHKSCINLFSNNCVTDFKFKIPLIQPTDKIIGVCIKQILCEFKKINFSQSEDPIIIALNHHQQVRVEHVFDCKCIYLD